MRTRRSFLRAAVWILAFASVVFWLDGSALRAQVPSEVQNLKWCPPSSKDCLQWSAAENGASQYHVYRGEQISLPCLLNASLDSCLESTLAATTTGPGAIPENPAPGHFYWFLVTSDNATGEGPSGNACLRPGSGVSPECPLGTLLPRVRNTSGSCPPSCAPSGECSASSDCCSANCHGACLSSCCAVAGALCAQPSDCCSSICMAGSCQPCLALGQGCSSSATCCSGNCSMGACAAPCAPNGGNCAAGNDCCSGNCLLGNCQPFFVGAFEWEAGMVAGVSQTYVPVSFSTPFAEYPVVVVTVQESNGSIFIRNVSKTGFEVRKGATGAGKVHYFACTPGVWLVNNNLIYAATYGDAPQSGNTQSHEVTFLRPFPRTPAILATACAVASDDPQTDGVVYGLETLPTTVTSDLDAGTKGAYVGINGGSTSQCLQVLAIASTGEAHNGGTYVSGGSGSLKAGQKFESGFFRVPSPYSGTVTFSSSFSANPIVILTGVNADYQGASLSAKVDSPPNTSSFSWQMGAASLGGVMWLAIDPGHDSVPAPRLK